MQSKSFKIFIFESETLFLRISLRKYQIYSPSFVFKIAQCSNLYNSESLYCKIYQYIKILYNHQKLCGKNI